MASLLASRGVGGALADTAHSLERKAGGGHCRALGMGS